MSKSEWIVSLIIFAITNGIVAASWYYVLKWRHGHNARAFALEIAVISWLMGMIGLVLCGIFI